MRTVGHSGSTVWLGSSYQLTKVVNLQHALKGTRLAKEQSIEIKRVHRRHYPMLSVSIRVYLKLTALTTAVYVLSFHKKTIKLIFAHSPSSIQGHTWILQFMHQENKVVVTMTVSPYKRLKCLTMRSLHCWKKNQDLYESEMWDSHVGEYGDCSRLGSNAVGGNHCENEYSSNSKKRFHSARNCLHVFYLRTLRQKLLAKPIRIASRRLMWKTREPCSSVNMNCFSLHRQIPTLIFYI
jgi:hypothetical protein